MSFIQASIQCTQDTLNEAEEFFLGLGALALSLYGPDDSPILEPAPGELKLWEKIKLVALFDKIDKTRVLAKFPKAMFDGLEDKNWTLAWQDDYQTMQFGRLFVGPNKPADTSAPFVYMEPGMAFGTGTHPTTAMCLTRLAEVDCNNKMVCDFGCGSGILAIAALKLGAFEAYGIDHDPQAHTATRENAEKNGEQVVMLADATKRGPYDIVVANILSGPLVELAPLLQSLVKPGGRIILSGIMNSQAQSVIDAYDINLEVKSTKEEWVMLEGVNA